MTVSYDRSSELLLSPSKAETGGKWELQLPPAHTCPSSLLCSARFYGPIGRVKVEDAGSVEGEPSDKVKRVLNPMYGCILGPVCRESRKEKG